MNEQYTADIINAELPHGVDGINAVTVGTKIYLLGGRYKDDDGDHYLKTINVFDTETNAITTLDTQLNYGIGRDRTGVGKVGTKIYLFGGQYFAGAGNGGNIWLNTIDVFDTETNTITTLDTKLPYEASNIPVGVVGTKIYLFGGSSWTDDYDNILVFDTTNNAITTLDATVPRYIDGSRISSYTVVAVGTKIYLISGFGALTYLDTIHVFDTETNAFIEYDTVLPYGNMGCAGAVVESQIYLFGGMRNKSNTVVFDTNTDTVSTLEAILPTAVGFAGAAAVDENIYLFGGLVSTTVFSKTISVFSIVPEPEPTLPEGDFYKVVNRQWVKHDAVKPTGSEWVKHDEYLY